MSEAAELSVIIKGKEVGVKALLAALERDLQRSDAAAERTAKRMEQDLARAQQQAALSSERLAQAQARTAGELLRNEAAAQRTALATLRLQQATEKAAKPPGKGLSGFFEDIKNQAGGAVLGMVGFGAAIGTVTTVAKSFADAFNLKTQLDATNASIAVQLTGVRDVGQTYAEAQRYANQYKLTQQEVTTALQASVGILRTSNASVEETFSVLQRLSVLNPQEGIEGAAFAVRELASGDIISLADRFNVSKDAAYAMRDAIAAGADPIAVVNEYLISAGVNMDALKVKTEGAAGAQKDLAIAQEQMALAQAEWAAGPGLAILETQTKVTIGLTRVLGGSGGLKDAFTALAQEWGLTTAQAAILFGAFTHAKSGAEELATGTTAATDATAEVTAVTSTYAGVLGTTGGVLSTTTGALFDNAGALEGDAGAALVAAENAKVLGIAKQALTDQATAAADAIIVGGGNIEGAAVRLANSSSLVDQLTAAYLRLAQATGEADRARRAGEGKSRLADQAAQTRDLTDGGLGFDAPGRKGTGDPADVLATIRQAQADLQREETKGQTGRTATAKGGGAARVKAETDTNDKLLSAARDYQDSIRQIEADGRKEREQAENSLRQAVLSGRAGFYAGLAGIDDNALRQDLSARYESAAAEAGRIAQTQGADAAQKYLEASRQQIEGESQIQQQIQEARDAGDAGQAEYLEGVLALQRAANEEELRQITAQGSAIASAEAARYSEAEARYAEHLGRMGGIAAANGTTLGASLPGAPAPIPGAPTAAASTSGGGIPAVQDVATPPAIDAQTGRLEGKLSEVVSAVQDVASRVGAVERAIGSLKQSRAAG